MRRREYFSKMKKLCKQLNALIPIKEVEDVNKLNDLLNEMFGQTLDGVSYSMSLDREVYINLGCNDDKMRDMLLHGRKLHFEPNEDMVEHPGVVIRYKPDSVTMDLGYDAEEYACKHSEDPEIRGKLALAYASGADSCKERLTIQKVCKWLRQHGMTEQVIERFKKDMTK